MTLTDDYKDERIGMEDFSRNTEGLQADVKNDVIYRGVFQLENRATAPRSGKLGQLIMLNGELNRWDTGTGAWVVIG